MQSRTPTQVASHAQKYFIRQNNLNKRKRRSSLFDIVSDAPKDGSAVRDIPARAPKLEAQVAPSPGGLSRAFAAAPYNIAIAAAPPGMAHHPHHQMGYTHGMPPPTFSMHAAVPPPTTTSATPTAPPLRKLLPATELKGETSGAAAALASLSMVGSAAAAHANSNSAPNFNSLPNFSTAAGKSSGLSPLGPFDAAAAFAGRACHITTPATSRHPPHFKPSFIQTKLHPMTSFLQCLRGLIRRGQPEP